jgi:1-acyl-sn-glycerol-3-phosphate acyltransferase
VSEELQRPSRVPARPYAEARGINLNYLWMPALMRCLCGIVLDGLLDVSGIENVPLHGGLLVVSNHAGTIDPALTGAYLPRGDLYFMAKSEYFQRPLSRFFVTGYHGFPVVRGSADRAALRRSLQLIGSGHAVVVYPEGHRSPDGRLQRPHPGAGFLAHAAAVPVLPVALWGTERVLPTGSFWPRRAPLHMRVGRADPVPSLTADGRRLSNQEVADLLMLRIADLLPPTRRGIFDGSRDFAAVPPPAA